MKIVLEIPTYPYDDEFSGFVGNVSLLKDRHYRKHLNRFVDRIADLSHNDILFGVPTLPIANGIDIDVTPLRKPSYTTAEVHILHASGMCDWHGIDRAIIGLSEYYSKNAHRKIVLHLAGSGPKLEQWKALAADCNVQNYVIFYGQLNQTELQKVYNRCTIAIESLGCYRKKVTLSSSIKSREYLAKGIPFIYSTPMDIFGADYEYALNVPDNNSPVDFSQVLAFYDNLYSNHSEEEIISSMRRYAEKHASVDVAMKSVIDYIAC